MLPRLHLFEINDSAWAPPTLRDTIVEALSRTLDWGHVLRGLAPHFARFLDETYTADGPDQTRQVLDLCAGAGGPVAILARELRAAGHAPPRFLMTDLHPRVGSWQRVRDEHPDLVDFVAEPVDAANLPPKLGRGRARVIINALHHFRPELAGAILRGAAKGSPGVFVAEGFERNPARFAPFAWAGIPALLAGPALAPDRRAEKALWSWLTPVALAASTWDGLVSTMRVYTERELRAMVAPLGDELAWTWGTYDFFPGGRGTFFCGVPRERAPQR
jgi:hypothetical protein